MSETIDIKEPPAALPYHHACELGMEGIVAKRIDAPYRSGHVQSCIKVKCERRLALPIDRGYPSRPTGRRRASLCRKPAPASRSSAPRACASA